MIRTIRRRIAAVASAVVLAAAGVAAAPAAHAEIDIYSTPGLHNVNGREWRTTCEKYSQTTRCRTEIKATVASYDSATGTFSQRTGWAFNNLTYQPSDWTMWSGNPLATPGGWTAADGRKWMTECNTPATGGNGCRSYAEVSVVVYHPELNFFTVSPRWVFNNIVRFTPGTMPPNLTTPVTIPDSSLRQCISAALGGAPATPSTMKSLRFLNCSAADLTGLEHATSLANVHLSGSFTDLRPVSGLGDLYQLTLHDNSTLQDLSPLASLPNVAHLDLRNTGVTDFAPLAAVKPLITLDIQSPTLTSLGTTVGGPNLQVVTVSNSPKLSNVNALATASGLETITLQNTGVAALPSLTSLTKLDELSAEGSKLASLAPLAGHPTLRVVNFSGTPVTDVAPLASLPNLKIIWATTNSVTNWTALKPKFDAGGLQIFWNRQPSNGDTPPW